jgi:hypothetical protein
MSMLEKICWICMSLAQPLASGWVFPVGLTMKKRWRMGRQRGLEPAATVPTEGGVDSETRLGEFRPNPKSTVGTTSKVNHGKFTTPQQNLILTTLGGLTLGAFNCTSLLSIDHSAPVCMHVL